MFNDQSFGKQGRARPSNKGGVDGFKMKFVGPGSDIHSDSQRDDLSEFQYSDHANCNNIGRGLRFKDTISELYDEREKNAVFNSSVKKGGAMHDFNATLKNASPEQMKQIFKGAEYDFKAHPKPMLASQFVAKVPKDFDKRD